MTSVDFGATRSNGNSVYARRDGQVLTVDREIVDELSKEAEPFRSTSLVAFNRGDVTAVEADFRPTSFALTQDAAGWSAGGQPVLAVVRGRRPERDRGRQEQGVRRRRRGQGAAAAGRDRDHQDEDRGRRGRSLSGPGPARLVATVSSRPGGFVVEGDVSGKLGAAFARAVTPPTPAPTKKP